MTVNSGFPPATHAGRSAAFVANPPDDESSADDSAHIGVIIRALCEHTGVDVQEYRRPTVERRIRNRMITLGATSLADYAGCITESADEAFALLERVSIKVSEFYRNPEVFAQLHTDLLPAMAAAARGRPLNIWSAGCGRGEEPWTLAMLLHDLGIDAVVHATDIDPSALSFAQTACYPQDSVHALPAALADRYLDRVSAGGVGVSPLLRNRVQFSRHDLLSNAPPPGTGRFDMICCRNVLIYFQREAQERTFQLLSQSLASDGVLCVGEAEWPCGPASEHLIAAGPRVRIFRRRVLEQAA